MNRTPAVEESQAVIARSWKYEQERPRVRFDLGGRELILNAPSKLCAWRAVTLFTKEPETIAWIDAMPEGSVLFDVGANIGMYSVWAGMTDRVSVLSFEPEATNFAILNENLRANGLTQRCVPFCLGISDVVGFGRMMVQSGGVGQSGHQVQVTRGERFRVQGDEQVFQGISTATLDHLVYERGFACPTHLKVDVDGLEPAVLRGAQRLIRDPRLRSVMIELMVNRESHTALITELEEAGFAKDAEMEKAVRNKTDGVPYTGNILFSRP